MRIIRLTLLLLLVGPGAAAVRAQSVVITDLTPVSGSLTAEWFTMVSLTNSSAQTLTGTLRASLVDRSGDLVAELYSQRFKISTGQQLSYVNIPWLRRFAYGSSPAAATLLSRGKLGYGDYLLCHEFIEEGGSTLAENCVEKRATLDLTFSLIYPFDRSTIEGVRPNLNWENIGQYGIEAGGVTYELLLVALEEGQTPAAALEQNPPLLIKSGLSRTSLLFPAGGRKLTVGKSYAWMVRVFKHDNEVIASLPWEFRVAETEVTKPALASGAYAMPTTTPGGQPYWFGSSIQLAFDNNEGMSKLTYRIVDLANRGAPLVRLPIIDELHAGLNTIDIPTTSLGLKDGQLYRLEIRTPRKHSYFLQFRYSSSI